MKRMCIILMALLLCCVNCVALGEEFTLRNSVCFGDTLQEVISKEAHIGVELKEDPDYDKEYWEKEKWCAVVEVAGIPDTTVEYYFDKTNKLVKMLYKFKTAENYNHMNDLLVQKYGSTSYNHKTGKVMAGFSAPEEWEMFPFFALRGKYALQEIPHYKQTDPQYYHWFFEQEDGSVIQIYHNTAVNQEFDSRPQISDYVAKPWHNLGYQLFDKESEEATEYMNYKKSIANDI